MPLDAICLTALKGELAEQIVNMSIDKIQQPERDLIVLSLRSKAVKSRKLLISAGTGDARVHLTEHKFENPKEPPMFCMLLRKHLTGAVISDVVQPQSERVLILDLETSTTLGERVKKRIIFEMIGRMSNLIITDSEGLIIDCLRRFGGDSNTKRLVLPGLIYCEPLKQEGKHDPLAVSNEMFLSLCGEQNSGYIAKWLSAQFVALSPLICREIVHRAYGDVDFRFEQIADNFEALKNEFFALIDRVKRNEFEPCLLYNKDGSLLDFSYMPILQYSGFATAMIADGFSAMLDLYFTQSAKEQRIKQKTASTLKTVKTARDRLSRKMAAQIKELEETEHREKFRQDGDIIMANLHLIKRGQTVLVAEDFYGEQGAVREIKLSELKSPQQNAAMYYKRYTKAKNARKFLDEQIKIAAEDVFYLESVIEQLERVENELELAEIRDELMNAGYIKKQFKRKQKQTVSAPMLFTSSSGMQIRVGKNNIQNDKLTFKMSLKSDVWLHAQKIHGAHVIISCEGKAPDDVTLSEAASLAAYYSASRTSTKVPIDYTLVRNVKKTPGSRPGMVIYTDYKTIMAEPKLL